MHGLFYGLDDPKELKEKLSGMEKSYEEGEEILSQGNTLKSIALILEGEVHLLRYDYWGHQHLLTHLETGDLFGESYALSGEKLQVTALAQSRVTILFLPIDNVLSHEQLRENLLYILAKKNLFLTAKLHHLTKRSSREKLLSFLSEVASRQGSSFTLPYNRQELADYLAMDRSALSSLLSKLQKEGLLHYKGSQIKLLRSAAHSLQERL